MSFASITDLQNYFKKYDYISTYRIYVKDCGSALGKALNSEELECPTYVFNQMLHPIGKVARFIFEEGSGSPDYTLKKDFSLRVNSRGFRVEASHLTIYTRLDSLIHMMAFSAISSLTLAPEQKLGLIGLKKKDLKKRSNCLVTEVGHYSIGIKGGVKSSFSWVRVASKNQKALTCEEAKGEVMKLSYFKKQKRLVQSNKKESFYFKSPKELLQHLESKKEITVPPKEALIIDIPDLDASYPLDSLKSPLSPMDCLLLPLENKVTLEAKNPEICLEGSQLIIRDDGTSHGNAEFKKAYRGLRGVGGFKLLLISRGE